MHGQPGHVHLSGARFVEAVRTASRYRLYDVGGLPALVEAEQGVAIACELYEVSEEHAARLAGIEPPGWERRPIELSDGSAAEAFLGPARGVDVSSHGGWAAYRGT